MEWKQRIDTWGPSLLTSLVLLGSAGAISLGWSSAATDSAFRVDPERVAVLEQPRWIGGASAAALADELGLDLSHEAPLLDSESLESWAARLLKSSPWIEEVVSVEPRFPSQADVRVRLVRPVLRLPDQTLVAWDGRRLGRADVVVEPALLDVLGPQDDVSLAECASAAIDVMPFRDLLEKEELGLAAVTFESGGRVTFVTHEGVAIEWGRSRRTGGFSAVDLPPGARIQGLLDVASGRPGLIGIERVIIWKERPEIYERP